MTIGLAQPKSQDDWYQARRLVEQYAAALDIDLSFQNFEYELQHLESEYAPPEGAFLLAEGIVEVARRYGYARLLLDTLPSMKEAQSLYASMGFKPTAAYRFNPVPGTAFLELTL